MLETLSHQLIQLKQENPLLIGLVIPFLSTGLLYGILFYILRPIFRSFEKDFAIVTLNVSAYPTLLICAILSIKLSLKITLGKIPTAGFLSVIDHSIITSAIIITGFWVVQLFKQVFIYYLKDYTKRSEAMWDDVLLPILSAVVPVLIYVFSIALVLNSFGVSLSGIWVTLGGATFVLGFALQDILANFFSGIVLLIDTPFQFGDILLLEDGSIGILRQIGIRVTQVYVFSNHCDVYIPNSVLQGQKITNLSRPTTFYIQSITVEIPSQCDFDDSKKLIEEIMLAHPDTLGDIDRKIEVMDDYYTYKDSPLDLVSQQKLGKLRILAEQDVNLKLEEIEQSLEALVATVQFAEKGGLTEDEIENVQQEYNSVLELIGFELIDETVNNRVSYNFQENNEEGLIELIRQWYRLWIKDPNLLDEDQNLIAEEWERKIGLLTRRTQRLSQKITNPQADETRLDDYVLDLIKWIKEKLKVPRKKWQEPKVGMVGMSHDDDTNFFIELKISFFVDDIKLEDGKRSDRVCSQIYQEIFRHFKSTYLDLVPSIAQVTAE